MDEKKREKSEAKANCPSCGQPFQFDRLAAHMPFCSPRCKMIDLNRWLGEEIGVPTDESESDNNGDDSPRREWKFDDE